MFRTFALSSAFALFATAQAAEIPFVPAASSNLPAAAAAGGDVNCSFQGKGLPADTIVIAAGGYSGKALSFQIDQSGQSATQMDIAVHADQPVALLLGAYEPTIWNVGWSKGTRVVAVFASGYHRQVVAGLPKKTPIITSSVKGPCGYDYVGSGARLQWLNPKAKALFDRPVTRVYNRPVQGFIDIVESTRSKEAYVTSSDVQPKSFEDKRAPKAGKAGLADAVQKGVLRLATAADVEAVQQQVKAPVPESQAPADIPPIAGDSTTATAPARKPRIGLFETYVVLKPFEYPKALYGGNAATFIVPIGVPAPTGEQGHSVVFDLNTGKCNGAVCWRGY